MPRYVLNEVNGVPVVMPDPLPKPPEPLFLHPPTTVQQWDTQQQRIVNVVKNSAPKICRGASVRAAEKRNRASDGAPYAQIANSTARQIEG
jgi:hypothetical protein